MAGQSSGSYFPQYLRGYVVLADSWVGRRVRIAALDSVAPKVIERLYTFSGLALDKPLVISGGVVGVAEHGPARRAVYAIPFASLVVKPEVGRAVEFIVEFAGIRAPIIVQASIHDLMVAGIM